MAPQAPLQAQINIKLAETGQREKLLNQLIDLLHISGWYEQTRHVASRAVIDHQNNSASTKAIANGDAESITDFHQVLKKVQDDCWTKIPPEVQKEMFQKIVDVLHQILK
ncbi:hypothetical protein ABW19_dt0207474 [Dactylella cylindrospora]|nr:hypothetical protein ABW19_dt0207474 [Dactylella cylindrospora]